MPSAPDPAIGLILLAAGGSQRLGQPKQLLAIEGTTLLRRAALAVTSSLCQPVVVVLGAEEEGCRREVGGLPLTIVVNADWASGMASSIRAGLNALCEAAPGIEAVVLALCDQPEMSAEVISALVQKYDESGAEMILSDYGTALGPPALFGRSHFAALLALTGDEGARRLLAKQTAPPLATIPFPDGLTDIDTLADYQSITRPLRGTGTSW